LLLVTTDPADEGATPAASMRGAKYVSDPGKRVAAPFCMAGDAAADLPIKVTIDGRLRILARMSSTDEAGMRRASRGSAA